jgi:hypothetical protein
MSAPALDFEDPDWDGLCGGYRVPYDPRPALRALECGEGADSAWKELWQDLYHQGDVGEASYAAVPYLVRIHEARGRPEENTYSMVATIEDARRRGNNPHLPDHLQAGYHAALDRLMVIGLAELRGAEDPLLVSSIIGFMATTKGLFALGRFALRFDEAEREHLFRDAGWG